jgi:hypothetical protein
LATMLRQEELAFIKALGSIELSPIFLRELRKAVAPGKKRKALVAFKANARSSPAPERQGDASGGAWSSRAPPQLPVIKRKADQFPAQTARLSQQAAAMRPSTSSLMGSRRRTPRAN